MGLINPSPGRGRWIRPPTAGGDGRGRNPWQGKVGGKEKPGQERPPASLKIWSGLVANQPPRPPKAGHPSFARRGFGGWIRKGSGEGDGRLLSQEKSLAFNEYDETERKPSPVR